MLVAVAESILYIQLVFSSVVQQYTLQEDTRNVRQGPIFWVVVLLISDHRGWIQPAPENLPDTDAADTHAGR